jgi:hypothetical protein
MMHYRKLCRTERKKLRRYPAANDAETAQGKCVVIKNFPKGKSNDAKPVTLSAVAASWQYRSINLVAISIIVVGPSVLDFVDGWIARSRTDLVAIVLAAAFAASRLWWLAEHGYPPIGRLGLDPRRFDTAALEFIDREHLPQPVGPGWGGAFFTWTLWPRYLVGFDSRLVIFDHTGMDRLAFGSPDTAEWKAAADWYNIQTVMALTDNERSKVGALCRDPAWASVYNDVHAVIFVRRAGNEDLLARLPRCAAADSERHRAVADATLHYLHLITFKRRNVMAIGSQISNCVILWRGGPNYFGRWTCTLQPGICQECAGPAKPQHQEWVRT